MKRLFTLFTGLCVMLLAGCNDEYDDSALVKRLDDFEQRLERLERLCNDMNTNLGSMQTIVTALDRGDYITSVEPLTENGSMVGYTIRFAKGTPIVVYNGKPGTAPVVSVKKDTDGIYYWTLDGEWITDGGKKLPVSGQNGTSPKLKIEEEYWYISYDDGTTWTKLDKATGEKGDDGAGILVDMDENYVYFTLPDGRTVTVPRAEGGSEPQPSVPHILYAVGQELVPGQGHYYATLWKDGKRQLLTDGSADSFCNGVYVDGNKVYVVGCEAIGDLFDDGYYEPYPLNVGVMWQFEVGNETQVTRSVLSDGKRATSPVAVAAAGENIYAAGFETLENSDRKAVYWRNGQMEYLSDGSTDALAYCVAAEGNDVYVGGYVQPADNKSGGIACIWKNGVAQNLTDGSTLAKVNAICIDGGVLYAAGAREGVGRPLEGRAVEGRPAHLFHRRGRNRSDGPLRQGGEIHHRRQHDGRFRRYRHLHLDGRGRASHLRRNGLVPGDGPRRSRKRHLRRGQRLRHGLRHLRGDLPLARLEKRHGNSARSRQLRQFHRVGARLRLRRHARVTPQEGPSFTRPGHPERNVPVRIPYRDALSYGAVYSRRPTDTTVTSTPDSCNRSITEAGALSSVMI